MPILGSIPLWFKRRDGEGRLVFESERGAYTLLVPVNPATEMRAARIEISIWHNGPEPAEPEPMVDLLDGRTVAVVDADPPALDDVVNSTPDANSPMDRIHKLLDGREWTAETLMTIADIVRQAGYTIGEATDNNDWPDPKE